MVRQTMQSSPEKQELSSSWPVERNPQGVPEVEALWLATQNIKVRIVDIRNLAEYSGEQGHVVGSELVPLSSLEQLAQTWDVEGSCVLVSETGKLAGEAAQMLESMGFTKVASLRGGMNFWNKLRFPISHVMS